MRDLLTVLLVAAATTAVGQPPPGYYDATYLLSGPALKATLYDIISPHTVHAYSELWGDFTSTDERDDNSSQVWDIYSDRPDQTEPYLYQFGSDQCSTSPGDEGVCYNREHSFPQSWFNDAPPMNSDLFHIYPTDAWVNQKRGNLPYGEVNNPEFTSDNGTKTGPSSTPGYSSDVCEPIDAYKGDLARTYFYMMTRYMNVVDQWSCDMVAGGDLSIWAENLLLQWHTDDPVSPKEIERNNDIFAIQHNRNPYIDQPQWVFSIWGPFAGVDEQEDQDKLWYAEGALHRMPSPELLNTTVLDAAGRTVYQAPFTTSTLLLPELPHGVYLARIGARALRFAR